MMADGLMMVVMIMTVVSQWEVNLTRVDQKAGQFEKSVPRSRSNGRSIAGLERE